MDAMTLPDDVKEQLERFEAALGSVERGLEPLLAADRRELEAHLTPVERAKVHITLANAVSTLFCSASPTLDPATGPRGRRRPASLTRRRERSLERPTPADTRISLLSPPQCTSRLWVWTPPNMRCGASSSAWICTAPRWTRRRPASDARRGWTLRRRRDRRARVGKPKEKRGGRAGGDEGWGRGRKEEEKRGGEREEREEGEETSVTFERDARAHAG